MLAVLQGQSQTLPNRRYTTADGLVADRVTNIVQDDKGFMWVGTYFGLSRYDGYRFTTISLPPSQQNKYVGALTVAEGKVYAGFWFNGGLMEYDKGNIKIFELNPENRAIVNDVIALCPHNKKGIVVAFGNNRIYQFTNGKFNHMFSLSGNLKNANILSMIMDEQGNTWVGTVNGLVVHTSKNKLFVLSQKNTIYLQEDSDGMTAVSGTGTNYQIEKYTKTGESFSTTSILWKSKQIVPVSQKSFYKNNIWMMDTTNRFLHINSQKNISVSSTNGVTKEDCHFLYADRENNLWVATHTGLVKISNLPALSYAFDEKAIGTGDITGYDSILYITNSHYLYTLSDNKLKKIHRFPDKNKQEFIGRVLWDNNHVWAGNWSGGLWKLKISDNKIVSSTFFDVFANTKIKVHAFISDKKGNIWISGENGIFYVKNGKFIHHFKPPDKNGKPMLIITLALDPVKNILWVGDNEFGIYKYRYKMFPVLKHRWKQPWKKPLLHRLPGPISIAHRTAACVFHHHKLFEILF